MMQKLYSASATVEGGRQGHVASSDGVLDLDLSMPKGLGGPGGTGTNPEQLFAAGYAACFESAIRLVARQEKMDVTELTGHLPNLPNLSREEAERLMQEAHGICPYSRATRGNMDVKLSVEA